MNKDGELIRMANDIAKNLAVYPEPEAVARVARHIREFWPLRMRSQLHAIIEGGGNGLSPLALAAGQRLFEER